MATSTSSAHLTHFLLPLLLLLPLSSSFSQAREIIVGGVKGAWKIPKSEDDAFNAWAASSRFRIGDELVFRYDAAKDSVVQVTRGNYLSCNATSPVAEYKDNVGGETKVKLERSGAYYFVSGAEGYCAKGEKMIVVVLSPRLAYRGSVSPAPAPALTTKTEFDGPAVAPTSGVAKLGFKWGLNLGLGLIVGSFGLFF